MGIGTDCSGHLPRGLSSRLADAGRRPLILLSAQRNAQDRLRVDLRLINLSGEVLDRVFSGTGDFASAEGTLPVVDNGLTYKRVEPTKAVVIDSYHEALDSDLELSVEVVVSSRSLGTREFSTRLRASEPGSAVLIWDTDLHEEALAC